jgi:tetratricopeptide (TPR) repeat protein
MSKEVYFMLHRFFILVNIFIVSLVRAEDLCSKFPDAYRLQKDKNWTAAQQAYETSVKLNSEDLAANYCNAAALHVLDRASDSLPFYKKAAEIALKEDPQNGFYYASLGKAQLDLKLDDEAIASYSRAIVIDPDYTKAKLDKAWLLHRKGKLNEAEHEYKELLRSHPDSTQAMLEIIYVLIDKKEYKEAFNHLESLKVVEPIENDGERLKVAGKLFHSRGRAEKSADDLRTALQYYKKAHRLNPIKFHEVLNWHEVAQRDLSFLLPSRDKNVLDKILIGQWSSGTGLTRHFFSAKEYSFSEWLSPEVTSKISAARGISLPPEGWSLPRVFPYKILKQNNELQKIEIQLSTETNKRIISVSSNGNVIEMSITGLFGKTITDTLFFMDDNNSAESAALSVIK